MSQCAGILFVVDHKGHDDEELRFEDDSPVAGNSAPTVEGILKQVGLGCDRKADMDPADLQSALQELSLKAKALNSIGRSVLHDTLSKRLKEVVVNAPARMVQAVLEKRNRAKRDDTQGGSIGFEELEPWPEDVDGGALIAEMSEIVSRYLVTGKGAPIAAALYVLLSYAYDCFDICPFFTIISPQRRCGKTQLVDVLGCLVNRAVLTSNVSPAALYRSIEKFRPTLLIDEADTFIHGKSELRGILNSGHRRSTAYILRCVGDNHEPKPFSTWAPKVVALIGRLPSTLDDRSIVVPMKRKRADERVERFRQPQLLKEAWSLRRKCCRWAVDHEEQLKRFDAEAPEQLHDRARDNWEPLIAIAELCDVGDEARNAALELSGHQSDDNETGTLLLVAIKAIFERSGKEKIFSKTLVGELWEREGEPWAEWGKLRRPITPNALAKLLKPYKIGPKDVYLEGKTLQGDRLEDFTDSFSRYTPQTEPLGPLGSSADAGSRHSDQPQEKSLPSGSEAEVKPSPDADPSGPSGWEEGGSGDFGLSEPDLADLGGDKTDPTMDDELFEEVI